MMMRVYYRAIDQRDDAQQQETTQVFEILFTGFRSSRGSAPPSAAAATAVAVVMFVRLFTARVRECLVALAPPSPVSQWASSDSLNNNKHKLKEAIVV